MKTYVKVIFKVQFSLSSLLTRYAVVSYARVLPLTIAFLFTAPNCVTQPPAHGQSHVRWSNVLSAHLSICLSIYLLFFFQSVSLSWRAMIHWKVNSDLEEISKEASFKRKL